MKMHGPTPHASHVLLASSITTLDRQAYSTARTVWRDTGLHHQATMCASRAQKDDIEARVIMVAFRAPIDRNGGVEEQG